MEQSWRVIEPIEQYWAEHAAIETTTEARSAAFFTIDESAPGTWTVTQRLCDPEGDGDWRVVGTVDLARAEVEGGPTLVFSSLSRLGLFGETTPDEIAPDEAAST